MKMRDDRKLVASMRATFIAGGFSLALCLALTGCGDGKPSASNIQNDIQQQLGECASIVDIQNIVKDDGQDTDNPHYLAEVEYDAELNAPLSYTADPNPPFAGTWKGLPSEGDASQIFGWTQIPFVGVEEVIMGSRTNFQAQTQHVKLTLNFIKGDNGWEMQ